MSVKETSQVASLRAGSVAHHPAAGGGLFISPKVSVSRELGWLQQPSFMKAEGLILESGCITEMQDRLIKH